MDEKELLEIIDRVAREGQTTLDLSYKKIKSLPAETWQLTNLKELSLSHNQLRSLPAQIGQLTNLTTLDLDNNKLSSLPAEIGQLTNLTGLYLSYNQLSSLPAQIGQLTNLKELSLWGNQLSSLPARIGKLTNLTRLDLDNNQLSSLPAQIGQLTNLTTLYLYNNRLSSLPAQIGQLTNLRTLSIHDNRLSSLPAQIGQLTNLTVLHLHNIQLSSLPAEIGQLKNLTELDLSKNQFTSLSAEIGKLVNLTKLNLSGNQLTDLPEEMIDLNMEIKWEWAPEQKGIFLGGNPWERPPVEIIKRGTEAVRQYFKSLVEERTLNEAKVLLVGNGGAGKTSLVKRLIKNEFNENEPKTHGINIDDWQIRAKGETIRAHLWDYGGQGIMQATHRVFFSVRSLYILVLNAREEPDPEDWLMNMKSLGGQSPVMIVVNKIDEHDYRLNEKHLVEKYPTIKGFYRISCKTGEGIEEFSKNLKEKLADVEMTRSKWGKDWLAVKERLECLEKDYISYEEYEQICQAENVKEEGQQKTLIEFLHDLGVVLHFKEFSLEHMKILNPEWITEGVYKIINSKVLKDKKGVLDKKSLAFILNEEKFEDDDFEKELKRSKYTKSLSE